MRTHGISPRARAYVRRTATQVMEATCRIERISEAGGINEDLTIAASERWTLYEGPCRLWEVTGRSGVAIGDAELVMQTTNLSIPWDAVPQAPLTLNDPANLPRHGDQFVILTHHTDKTMVGQRGEIQESAKAGDLRATRRYAVTMVQSKGDHE